MEWGFQLESSRSTQHLVEFLPRTVCQLCWTLEQTMKLVLRIICSPFISWPGLRTVESVSSEVPGYGLCRKAAGLFKYRSGIGRAWTPTCQSFRSHLRIRRDFWECSNKKVITDQLFEFKDQWLLLHEQGFEFNANLMRPGPYNLKFH